MNFSQTLQHWYGLNKRDLPWRNTRDAYVIWLSEVILQQTRVEQGMPYFYKFVERFATVTDFAQATEDEVLKLWQGLGYYSRARNMLKTAQLVQARFGGVFPVGYADLISLKGIGEYTAAAISSFAGNQPHAVVDGNVYRVLARYFGVAEPINSTKGKKLFQQMADDLLDVDNPGQHNQAVMEFGALQCKPKSPNCGTCPLSQSCFALAQNQVANLPVKLKTVKVKERFFNYFVVRNAAGQLLLNKRADGDIWANMYDLPLLETDSLQPIEQLLFSDAFLSLFGGHASVLNTTEVKKHVLTHQRIYTRFIHLQLPPNQQFNNPNWFYSPVAALANLAMPKIIFAYLDSLL